MFLYDTIANFVNMVFNAIYEALQMLFNRLCGLLTVSPTRLVDEYEAKYGDVHPKIFVGGFDDVKKIALSTKKLVVVYIHSEHNDSVCRNVFTNQLVIELMDSNFIFYVEFFKGPHMRKLMELTNTLLLPNISVLHFRSPTRCTVVNRLDGTIDPDSLIGILLSSVDYRPPPDHVESSRKVIEEQNEEFRRAVEIDSIKFKEKEIKRQDEVRRRNNLEKIKKEKKEKKDKITENRKEKADKFKEVKRTGDTKIRVRLPDGNSIETLFSKNDVVGKIYEWVEVSEYLDQGKKKVKIPYDFNLSIPHPSTLLSDKTVTLESANLVPSASLLLTSLDETSDEES